MPNEPVSYTEGEEGRAKALFHRYLSAILSIGILEPASAGYFFLAPRCVSGRDVETFGLHVWR